MLYILGVIAFVVAVRACRHRALKAQIAQRGQ